MSASQARYHTPDTNDDDDTDDDDNGIDDGGDDDEGDDDNGYDEGDLTSIVTMLMEMASCTYVEAITALRHANYDVQEATESLLFWQQQRLGGRDAAAATAISTEQTRPQQQQQQSTSPLPVPPSLPSSYRSTAAIDAVTAAVAASSPFPVGFDLLQHGARLLQLLDRYKRVHQSSSLFDWRFSLEDDFKRINWESLRLHGIPRDMVVANQWKCSSCTLVNQFSDMTCTACDQPRVLSRTPQSVDVDTIPSMANPFTTNWLRVGSLVDLLTREAEWVIAECRAIDDGATRAEFVYTITAQPSSSSPSPSSSSSTKVEWVTLPSHRVAPPLSVKDRPLDRHTVHRGVATDSSKAAQLGYVRSTSQQRVASFWATIQYKSPVDVYNTHTRSWTSGVVSWFEKDMKWTQTKRSSKSSSIVDTNNNDEEWYNASTSVTLAYQPFLTVGVRCVASASLSSLPAASSSGAIHVPYVVINVTMDQCMLAQPNTITASIAAIRARTNIDTSSPSSSSSLSSSLYIDGVEVAAMTTAPPPSLTTETKSSSASSTPSASPPTFDAPFAHFPRWATDAAQVVLKVCDGEENKYLSGKGSLPQICIQPCISSWEMFQIRHVTGGRLALYCLERQEEFVKTRPSDDGVEIDDRLTHSACLNMVKLPPSVYGIDRWTVTNAKGLYFHCQLNKTRTPRRPVTWSVVMHKSAESDPSAGRYLLEIVPLSVAEHTRNTHIGRWLMPNDQYTIWMTQFINAVPYLPSGIVWLTLDYLWIRCDIGSLVDFAHQRKRLDVAWRARDLMFYAYDPMWRIAAWTRNGDSLHLEQRDRDDGEMTEDERDEWHEMTAEQRNTRRHDEVVDDEADDLLWHSDVTQARRDARYRSHAADGRADFISFVMDVPNTSQFVRPQVATVASGKREAVARAQAELEMAEVRALKAEVGARLQWATEVQQQRLRIQQQQQRQQQQQQPVAAGDGNAVGHGETKRALPRPLIRDPPVRDDNDDDDDDDDDDNDTKEGKSENKEDDDDDDDGGEEDNPTTMDMALQVVNIIRDQVGCTLEEAMSALLAANSDPEAAIALLEKRNGRHETKHDDAGDDDDKDNDDEDDDGTGDDHRSELIASLADVVGCSVEEALTVYNDCKQDADAALNVLAARYGMHQ